MNRRIFVRVYIVITFVLIFGSIYVMKNWGYLPFQIKDYGRAFNKKRMEVGQPLIEDYFVLKDKNKKIGQTWHVPDSLKYSRLHTGKVYSTRFGYIEYEADFYRKYDLHDLKKHQLLIRRYFWQTDSLSYSLNYFYDMNETTSIELSIEKGDSILETWSKESLK